jgi:tetratricopeptide (TPR) repeat protein
VRWALAAAQAAVARIFARLGQVDPAMSFLESVIVPIERAPATASNYVRLICDAAETLWLLQRLDHIDTIVANLRDKVIASDFRYTSFDGRLSLGRLSALQERFDEASRWFDEARRVLDEQGARPLRAITDYDEALMYARRDAPGDKELARPLLDAAVRGFEDIGMPGWLRRASELDTRIR